MKQRAITALFFVAAMIGGVFGGRESFFVLFSLIAAGALWEFWDLLLGPEVPQRLFRKTVGLLAGLVPVLWWGFWVLFDDACGQASAGAMAEPHWQTQLNLGAGVVLLELFLVLGLLLFELFAAAPKPFQNTGILGLGFFYIVLPVLLLFALATPACTYQPGRVFGLMGLVWVNDTLAYLIGSRFGKTKLFERISPKKTWEGTLGGGLCTVLIAWGLAQYSGAYSTAQWLALGVVISIFGNLGDLIESMLKRSVGVKDSGSLFPGHGGFLDRFDAFLFMLPFAWAVVTLLGG
ncbi:MAG: phosphatidate cytidylyltransferase [Saprospiraceae bacterium]|nr:phosphatidate cytidylyltransferase [Saprospiraceae bacterium]